MEPPLVSGGRLLKLGLGRGLPVAASMEPPLVSGGRVGQDSMAHGNDGWLQWSRRW